MQGVAEVLLSLGWKLLPQRRRTSLSRRIIAAQRRARTTIPRSDATVYAFSRESEQRFAGLLAEGVQAARAALPYSVIVTCRNEARTIGVLLDSLQRQTAQPKEVVICDGGSSDGTLEAARSWETERRAAGAPPAFALVLLGGPPRSIAAGRNVAARHASCDIFVFADAGNTLDRSWAERLLVPFAHRPETEVSMGWYRPITEGLLAYSLSLVLVPELESVDPAVFLPSGRSLAVRREAFHAAGGFPEHLTRAGEDSLFDYYLKSCARHLAFVPDAISYWHFPSSTCAMFRTVAGYARGDAEAGTLFWEYYLELLPKVGKIAVEALLALVLLPFCSNLPVLALTVLVAGSALGRTATLVRSYAPFRRNPKTFKEKAARVAAVLLLVGAQAVGFLRGLRSFAAVEHRRIGSAEHGHLVLLLGRPLVYDRADPLSAAIRTHLEQGWYLTVVFVPQSGIEPPFYAHPHLESHVRAEFALDGWWEKHRRFLDGKQRELAVVDLCEDSLSRDLAAKLQAVDAAVRPAPAFFAAAAQRAAAS